MSTEQQRQQWRELAAAATPGEWEPRMDWGKDMTFEGDVFYYGEAQGPHLELDTWDVIGKVRADAAFIAAARAAVPQLLADVDALTQERDAAIAERNAAWKREEQRRVALDEAKAIGNKYIAKAEELRAERDALAAELERVRSERNDWHSEYTDALAEIDALTAEMAKVRAQVTKLVAYKQRIQDDAVAAAQELVAHTPTPGTR